MNKPKKGIFSLMWNNYNIGHYARLYNYIKLKN